MSQYQIKFLSYQPLFIVCSGRSFSSVVCGMLGRHPDLYDLPEVNLFVADTVNGLFEYFEKVSGRKRLRGLARTIAQLHDGEQTEETVHNAWEWLGKNGNLSTKDLAYYIAGKIQPQRFIEKSPSNCYSLENLIKMHDVFPNALYIHLLRHPRSTGKSYSRFVSNLKFQIRRSVREPAWVEQHWLKVQHNIIHFTKNLPIGSCIQLRGELLLSEPDNYLRQICEWLGVRADQDIIEAMKHPEDSPYAKVGPANAGGGGNPGYLKDPKLRVGGLPEVSLLGPLEWMENNTGFSQETIELARQFGYQ